MDAQAPAPAQATAKQDGPVIHTDMLGLHGYKLLVEANSFIQIWRRDPNGEVYLATSFYLIGNQLTAIPANAIQPMMPTSAMTSSCASVASRSSATTSAKSSTPSGRVTRSAHRRQQYENVTPPAANAFDQYLLGK